MPLIRHSIPHVAAAPRFAVIALAALAVVLMTLEARATVRFVATELSQCPYNEHYGGVICIGETITIGFRIEADAGEEVIGIGAAVMEGYSIADFIGGEAVDSIFHGFADPRYGAFDGLDNYVRRPLSRSYGVNGPYVQFLQANSFTPRTFNPLDPGLDGVVGGGDSQFRVHFRVGLPGVTTLSIGTRKDDPVLGNAVFKPGSVIEDAQNLLIEIGSDQQPRVVVPEPGSALLVGFGLAGFAGRRKKSRRTGLSRVPRRDCIAVR